MKKDNIEFFDIVNENDEIIGKISENMQDTVKPSQLRFINIIITNDEIKGLMNDKPSLFKTDYFVVMEYLFNKKYV